MKGKKVIISIALGIIIATLAILSACAQAPKTQTFNIGIGHQDTYARPALVNTGAPVETNVTTFYKWMPSVLVVHKGDSVVLNVTNYSKARAHSFVLPEFGLNTGELNPEKTAATIEFVADKAGIFQFNCGIPPDPASTPQKCSPEHVYQAGWLIVLER